MYAASLASIDCVEQIVLEENINCDFDRCGHLEVACKQKHFETYQRRAELIEVELNDNAELDALLDADEYDALISGEEEA